MREFVRQTGVTFPVGFELGPGGYGRFAGAGGISPFPLDVVIDADDRIAYVSAEYDSDAVRRVIEDLLSR